MNVKPNDEQLTALARFAASAEWGVIEKWLLANREAYLQVSLSHQDAISRQAQGSIQAIDSFIRNTRGAEESSSAR